MVLLIDRFPKIGPPAHLSWKAALYDVGLRLPMISRFWYDNGAAACHNKETDGIVF
jgi:hypothetical protein